MSTEIERYKVVTFCPDAPECRVSSESFQVDDSESEQFFFFFCAGGVVTTIN